MGQQWTILQIITVILTQLGFNLDLQLTIYCYCTLTSRIMMKLDFLSKLYLLCASSAALLQINAAQSGGRGCYYKGRFYFENWEDGCEFRCRCLNTRTGHYRCHKRCINVTSPVPSGCSLEVSKTDECCQEVICLQQDNTHSTQRYPTTNIDSISSKGLDIVTPVAMTTRTDSTEVNVSDKLTSGQRNPGGLSDDSNADSPHDIQMKTFKAQQNIRTDTESDGPTERGPMNDTVSTKDRLNDILSSHSDRNSIKTNFSVNVQTEGVTSTAQVNETMNSSDDDSVYIQDVTVTATVSTETSLPTNDTVNDHTKVTTTNVQTSTYNGNAVLSPTSTISSFILPYPVKTTDSLSYRDRMSPNVDGSNLANSSGTYSDISNYISLYERVNKNSDNRTVNLNLEESISHATLEYPLANKLDQIGKENSKIPDSSGIYKLNISERDQHLNPRRLRISNNNKTEKAKKVHNTIKHHSVKNKQAREKDMHVDIHIPKSKINTKGHLTDTETNPIYLKVSRSSTEVAAENVQEIDITSIVRNSSLVKNNVKTLRASKDTTQSNHSRRGDAYATHANIHNISANKEIRNRIHNRQRRLRKILDTHSPDLLSNKKSSHELRAGDFWPKDKHGKRKQKKHTEEQQSEPSHNPLLLFLTNPDPRSKHLLFQILRHNRHAVLKLKGNLKSLNGSNDVKRNGKTIFTATGAIKLKTGTVPNVSHGALTPAGSWMRNSGTRSPWRPTEQEQIHGMCSFEGRSYDTGHIWFNGCKSRCICTDGHTNTYDCRPRCGKHPVVPPHCILVVDSSDRCCLVLYCNYHVTRIPKNTQNKHSRGLESNSTSTDSLNKSRPFSGTVTSTRLTIDTVPNNNRNKQVQKSRNSEEFLRQILAKNTLTMNYLRIGAGIANSTSSASRTRDSEDSDTFRTKANQRLKRLKSSEVKPGPVHRASKENVSDIAHEGCNIDDRVYLVGESWTNGCRFRCFCANKTTMMVKCVHLCVRWNLPSVCTYDPPPSGKCCEVPRCPPGYRIRYPSGYQPE